MAATTTRGAFPYPTGGDNWKNVRLAIQAVADRLGVIAALYESGTAATRPTAGVAGRFHFATDTGRLSVDSGTAWSTVTPTVVRTTKTFTLSGEVKLASGDDLFVPPFFVAAPPGQTVRLAGMRHRINSGTSATVELRRNGTLVTGFSATVTTTSGLTDPADVTLADGDLLALVVTAVSGTPKNLTLDVLLDVEV